MSEYAWQPDPDLSASSNATRMLRALGVADWAAMTALADREPARFHEALLRETGLRFFAPYDRIMDDSGGIEWVRWCTGGTTNVVLNALDRWRGTPTWDKPALHWEGEDGQRRTLSYRALDREVCRLAGGLRALGLAPGDVVALYMPNVPEAVAAMLAIVKVGCIAMPLFSGFGADAIATRVGLGEARALVTIDASPRRGRMVSAKAIVDEAAPAMPSLRHVIVLRHSGVEVDWHEGRDVWWHALCESQPDDAPTEPMDAEAPMLLVFTSGTTGKPKGVVHTHIGFPAKLLIDMWLMLDCRPEDRMLWMSDMGWVIGPMLVYGVPMVGATLVLVEGAPDHPDPMRMWRLVDEFRVSWLGVAPTTIRGFMAHGGDPSGAHALSSLRVMASSGEAWTPDAWNWLFERIGARRVPILNFSGGTEMVAILGCTVLEPLKTGAFNCAVPGTGADVADDAGRSAARGTVGELVMRSPSIGLTRGLWKDRERYLDAYWRTWPGVWHHGDFASRDADGHWRIYGRSDDVMKFAGKRTGPSEIETLLMGTGKLGEAAAIAVPDPVAGSALVIVCAPRDGVVADAALEAELTNTVVRGLGVPFRPKAVIFVADLPKTRNMKIMRRVIRAACLGQDPGDLSSLSNPESVDALRAHAGRFGA